MDINIKRIGFQYYSQIMKLLEEYKHKEIVLFCVGNYKIWFDSFASAVAAAAKQENINAFVYGGKDYPIVPDNLPEYIDFVKNKHPKAAIIVVDNILTTNQQYCGKLIISKRATEVSSLYAPLLFGNISVLLNTNPYINPELFLEKQSFVVECIKQCFVFFKNLH